MKKLVTIILILTTLSCLKGQQDTSSLSYDFFKKPGIAALEVFSINLLINRYDAWFFRDGGEYWAKVSPASWQRNLQVALEWDWNSFGTNWFGHPLHGSFMFNSARSLGMTYWESCPYSLLGSYMWEYYGETHPPSGNDLLTTSLGGIYLGELTHRMSDRLLNHPSTKFGKIWRYSLATILNPIRMFNRWVNGVPYHDVTGNNNDPDNHDLYSYIAIGGNMQVRSLNLETKGGGPFVEFFMGYGNFFQDKDFYRPFETFQIRGWLRFVQPEIRRFPFINISSHAVLWGKNLRSFDGYNLFIGAFQHFDYLHDEVIEIGSLGFSSGIKIQRQLKRHWEVYLHANIGPTVLGGSNNEIVGQFTEDPESLRDYILGPGFLIRSELFFRHEEAGTLSGKYQHYTFYVVSGPNGAEILDLLSLRYSVPIISTFSLGFDYTRYYRTVKYEDYPMYNNFSKDLYEFRLFVSYEF
jgi:hypothetical protein